MIRSVKSAKDIEDYLQEYKIPSPEFSVYDMECVWNDITSLPSSAVIVEIGVKYGTSATAFALMASPGVEIHSIDIDDVAGRKEYWERTGLDQVVTYHLGDSVDIAKTWEKSIDVLFIDGDHSYEGCKRDIEAWIPFLKPQGRVYLHDCDETSPGVMWAISEFVYTKEANLILFKGPGFNSSMAKIML